MLDSDESNTDYIVRSLVLWTAEYRTAIMRPLI